MMQAAKDSIKKIIWTVDPFQDKEQSLQYVTAHAIKLLTRGIETTIEPVYFLNSSLTSGPIVIPRDWLHDVQKSGQRELTQIIKRVKLQNVRPLHLVSAPYLSIREAVDQINRLASRWRADLIVSSTHARKGIKRFFLGSFAETLLLYSNVPLLFVSPQWKRQFRFKHILFPTDFSPESYDAFLQILPLARSLQCEIHLFHKLLFLWPAAVPMTLDSAPLFQDVFDEELRAKQELAIQWASVAKTAGIPITIEVDERQDSAVVDAILLRAKKRPGIIAMASKSSEIRTVILGSTTRKIVREASFPVWVLHPRPKVEGLKKAA